ncbi:MAG: hypothetical protein HYY16_16485 [Planctomycetes bacterium]|nr:hypothetical protein [Planctomycetota bacterium]
MVKRLPWIDVVALGAGALMAVIVPSDPLLIWRFVLSVWVLVHMFLIAQRFYEDILEVREFLRDLEKADPRLRGLAVTGDRVFMHALLRILRLTLRFAWPMVALGVVVIGTNVLTWLLMAGWRPGWM